MPATITKDMAIEELVKACPKAVGLLIEEGLPCVVCGEPFWGTVAELAGQKGWTEPQIDRLVEKLRKIEN